MFIFQLKHCNIIDKVIDFQLLITIQSLTDIAYMLLLYLNKMTDTTCIYLMVILVILVTVRTQTIHMNEDEISPLHKIAWMRFLVSVDATKWDK